MTDTFAQLQTTRLMKNNEILCAVSTRVPTETHKRLTKLSEVTKKPVAALVNDALIEYLEAVYNKNYKPSKSLKIDQYAVNI